MPAHPKTKHKHSKPSGKAPSHLDLIRQLPCILSGRDAEAAHIRYADARYEKPLTGIGMKPDDKWTVPLCPELHRLHSGSQHTSNEKEWWAQFGIDPLRVAKELWGKNRLMMERVIMRHQPIKPDYIRCIDAILRGEK